MCFQKYFLFILHSRKINYSAPSYHNLIVSFKCNSFRLTAKCNVLEKWQKLSYSGRVFGGYFLWITWIGKKKKTFLIVCCSAWIYQLDIFSNNAHDKDSMSSFYSSFHKRNGCLLVDLVFYLQWIQFNCKNIELWQRIEY
jgi:hypothetical protein